MSVTNHKVKNEYQQKALNVWRNAGYKGSIICGTGFGKSRVGVLAVAHTINNFTCSSGALVLVPTVQLQDQFKEEFEKWGHEHILDDVEIVCYQSAYKYVGKHYDIVICDEVHLGLSPEYRKFFSNNTYDKLLCMTATLPEENEYKLHLFSLAPTIFTITLDECVDLELVSPYKLICVPLALTDEEKSKYKSINNKFVYWKYKLGDFDAFNTAKQILADSNATPQDKMAASRFFACIRERKKIVDFASGKIEKLKQLVAENEDKKILVFGGANAFTDILTEATAPMSLAYHSKKTVKQRREALQKFKDGDINVLCSTKALNQGLDIPNASVGVICGLTSKSLTMIQRLGRLIRFEKDKEGTIYILYVKDSQEEKWLRKSVETLKNITWL